MYFFSKPATRRVHADQRYRAHIQHTDRVTRHMPICHDAGTAGYLPMMTRDNARVSTVGPSTDRSPSVLTDAFLVSCAPKVRGISSGALLSSAETTARRQSAGTSSLLPPKVARHMESRERSNTTQQPTGSLRWICVPTGSASPTFPLRSPSLLRSANGYDSCDTCQLRTHHPCITYTESLLSLQGVSTMQVCWHHITLYRDQNKTGTFGGLRNTILYTFYTWFITSYDEYR